MTGTAMRRVGLALLAAVIVGGTGLVLTTGCANIDYLAHSASGHIALLDAARPVPEWLADPKTPAKLQGRLALSQQIRDFAVAELALPDNASYRRYADLQRNAAVWNVVAAPELSLKLQTWCFPVVGCVGYRGYFDRPQADAFADEMREQGLDVDVYGVPAYSTLGRLPGAFFADPLLNTFIYWPEVELARMIFHELAHQVVYASGDTMFNESFATAVERIGSARWMAARASPQAAAEYAALERRREEFRALTLRARGELEAVYRSAMNDDEKRAAKAEALRQLRTEYTALRDGPWQGFAGYDAWMARANNASLGVLAAYNEFVPQFERLYEREGRDLPRFYAAVRALADLPKDERRATLARL
ncbi:MAG TPA: aminopeptidase [Burkholderiaceae bacterium]|nr:aminopeptidase [Burkholderiaceae bacterium]